MNKKLGRPPEGKNGKIISFNCWQKNLAKVERLKKQNKLSERLNELLDN